MRGCVVLNLGGQLDWIWNQLRDFPLRGLMRAFPGKMKWRRRPSPWKASPSHCSLAIKGSEGSGVACLCPPLLLAFEWVYSDSATFANIGSRIHCTSHVGWKSMVLQIAPVLNCGDIQLKRTEQLQGSQLIHHTDSARIVWDMIINPFPNVCSLYWRCFSRGQWQPWWCT